MSKPLFIFYFLVLLLAFNSLERALFILAALFLWIDFFLAALSAREIALVISASFNVFFANLIAISIFLRMV